MARKSRQEDRPAGAPLWMATFADMVTLLLAFFVMLLSFSSIQESKFQEAVASLQGALGVMQSPQTIAIQPEVLIPEPQESEVEEMLQVVTKLELALQEEGIREEVELEFQKDGIAIRISTPFLFRPADDHLKADARRLLTKLGHVLSAVDNRVRVEGHTDNIPIATADFPSNWELSTARAVAVLKEVRDGGIDADRLSATGYAEYQPVETNATAAGRRANRRVDLFLEYTEGQRNAPILYETLVQGGR